MFNSFIGFPLMMWLFIPLIVVPFWFIFLKAGYSKWLSILMIIPIVNFVLLGFLAFSKWPSLNKEEVQ